MESEGRRIYPDPDTGAMILSEGDYGRDLAGVWCVRPPSCHAGTIPDHTVIEHQDETITVEPSIVLQDEAGREIWHGYLVRGRWRLA